MDKLTIVWLRRNLRLEDNKPFAAALGSADKILPIFIFDTTILQHFPNPCDRRLSFLVDTLCLINDQLRKLEGKLSVFHGNPLDIIPKLVAALEIENIYADQDYEPSSIDRDSKLQNILEKRCKLNLYYDHLLVTPDAILKKFNEPYKVYTPYMNGFKQYLVEQGTRSQNTLLKEYGYHLEGRLSLALPLDLPSLDLDLGAQPILEQIGYLYKKDRLWDPKNGPNALNDFVNHKINAYKTNRDFLHLNGTSSLSPYLRFGLISIRSCYRAALAIESTLGVTTWVNELIWREFYAHILYYFPNTIYESFQKKYRNIPWRNHEEDYDKFIHGQTGYPIVDAAVHQLLTDGWMHNRARMIVASFFTKNLLLDWRQGEHFFSQYLMDYELASNVGGWQWSSSCGTDAQPYFRIFNPYLQSKKFDPDGAYIKKYLPKLARVPGELLHSMDFHTICKDYPKPMVNYASSRIRAIETFKKAGG